uniref:Uncharacterized protein n=2 Tax=Oryza TaxID=4527 RepID=A0A0E0QBV4_ORYRU
MQQHKSTKLKKQAMPKGRKEADERNFEGKILKKEARERVRENIVLRAPLQFEAGRAQANFAVHRQLFVATARSSVGGIDDGMHGQMSCAAHMTGCRRPVHRPRRGEDVRARGIYQFCLDLMSLASSISLDRRLTALCQSKIDLDLATNAVGHMWRWRKVM